MSFTLQRSAGGTDVRNAGGTKNSPLGWIAGRMVIGYWPIFGMGTFKTAAGPATTCTPDPSTGQTDPTYFNELWPNVYRTLTLTYSDAGGTSTHVYQYQDYCDIPLTIVVTGTANGPSGGWIGSPVVTSTSITQSYNVMFSTPGVFTAVLSNQFNAASGWPGKVSSALSLINGIVIQFPDSVFEVTADYNSTIYLPTSTGSTNTTASDLYLCGAMNGIPCRDNGNDLSIGKTSNPSLHSIFDLDSPQTKNINIGGLVCAASWWTLTGNIPIGSGSVYSALTDHKTIYGQKFDLSTFLMDAVVTPNPAYVSGIARQNPQTFFTGYAQINPSDVPLNIAGATYGIVGFRPTVY